MKPQSENPTISKNQQSPDRFSNTDRDEATLGTRKARVDSPNGLADEDQPVQRPPEAQPEPRPVDPILKQSPNSNLT